MKILSLGLDNSVLNESSALARRVIEYGKLVEKYTVIVPNQKNEKIELSDKVVVYGSGGNSKFFQLVKIFRAANKLLLGEEYNIVTAQDQYYLALAGLCLAKKFKVGLEIQAHGFEKYHGLRKLIAKYVLPRANAVRCVSQRLKKQLVGEFNVTENKITVAPIFPTTSFASFSRKGIKGAKFIFLTVGRLVPVKNIGLQIEAMAEVAKKYPKVELWIIGGGTEKEKLKLNIRNYKLENNVKLLGWQDNLENYYNQANAFLLTSNSEGWGLAVIEAAGFGLPIIMTDVGCAGEFIINDYNGLVIPRNDKQRLAGAMIKVMADNVYRDKLRNNILSSAAKLPDKIEIFNLYLASWVKAAIK